MLKLYSYFRSSASWRVRICLALKGVDYEVIPINLRDAARDLPDYRALNPQGLVPTLITNECALSQSLPIVEYLESIYPEPPLLPRGPFARAQVQAMATLIACDIHPLNNLRVLNYLRTKCGHDEAQITAWYQHWVLRRRTSGAGTIGEESWRLLLLWRPRFAGRCMPSPTILQRTTLCG